MQRGLQNFLIVVAMLAAQPALAQSEMPPAKERPHYQAGPGPTPLPGRDELARIYYESLTRQAIMMPPNFDFERFRVNYAQTDQYDPYGNMAKEFLLKLAYTAQTDPDPKKRKEAMEKYGTTLAGHLANLDVVNQALSLSRQDRRFGDPKLFNWLREGITNSVFHSGTGATLDEAYDVMTLGEENALLAKLNLKVLNSKTEHAGIIYYNMHEVKDPVHEATYTVFVDVTQPMTWLEYRRQVENPALAIKRQ